MSRSTLPPVARPARPVSAELRQRALVAFTLGALSLLGLAFIGNLRRGFYVVGLMMVFAAVAIWLGVTVSKAARRSGAARPRGAFGGILLGSFGLALCVMWLVVLGVFWSQLTTYSACTASANTIAGQQACQNQFTNSIDREVSRLESGR
jgi:hypothetical protein